MDTLESKLRNKLFMNCIKFIVAMDTVLVPLKKFIIDKLGELCHQLQKLVTDACNGCTVCCDKQLCEKQTDVLRRTITCFHLKGKPSFLGSTGVDTLKEPWNLAKFYMSPMPRNKTVSEEDADFQCCVSVITNNTHMIKYTKDITVYDMAMEHRNKALAHSSKHELVDSERDECFVVIKKILNDMLSHGFCSADSIARIDAIRTSTLELSSESLTSALKQLDIEVEEHSETVDKFMNIFKLIADEDHQHVARFVDYSYKILKTITEDFILTPQIDEGILAQNWNFLTFLIFIKNRAEIESLPERYRAMLQPQHGKEINLPEWDLFLLSYIPSLPLNIQLGESRAEFIKRLQVIRDKYLDDPGALHDINIASISEYLDKDGDFADKYVMDDNKKYSSDDNVFARFIIAEWQRMELKTCKQKATDPFMQHIKTLAQGYMDMERRLSEIEDAGPSTSRSNNTGSNYITRAVVQILDDDSDDKVADRVTELVTASNRPESIEECLKTLNNALAPSKLVGIKQGCLILEVSCPSTKSVLKFLDDCRDGTLLDTMDCLREACLKELGLAWFRFDVVLTQTEVLRCMNNIGYEINMKVKSLRRRIRSVGVQQAYSRPGSTLMGRFEQLESVGMIDYDIRRCHFMPDGHLLLACWNCFLLMNKELKDIINKLEAMVWDFAVVDDTKAAVVKKDRYVQFVKMEVPFLQLGDKLDVGRGVRCNCIDVMGQTIYTVCEVKGRQEIRILTSRGELVKMIELDSVKSGSIVCIKLSRGEDKIFLSNWGKNEVVCRSTEGQVIYKYSDGTLKGPEAIYVDEEENVLVCGFFSNNTHVLDRHGVLQSVMFTEHDGLKFPRGICYREPDRCLVLGQFGRLLLFRRV